jgi:hypothetical protein
MKSRKRKRAVRENRHSAETMGGFSHYISIGKMSINVA